MNHEPPDVKLDLEREEEPNIKLPTSNIHWIIERAREFQKNIYFCFIGHTKAFDCVDHTQSRLWFFLVVMYGCEIWTIKKAGCQRIDAFELWCWRRLLRVPWTARRSNQSILKEISPGCSLVGLMLKLKLPYFGHLMQRTDSLEKTLMLGKIEGGRRRGRQRMR